MDIEIGAKVEDKNGKSMGTVSNVVIDSWTGEISKFSVENEALETTVFYSPDVVAESTSTLVKLKIALGEARVPVQYGAKVFDKDGNLIGKVNYLLNDPLTGEIKVFKVEDESTKQELILSLADVERVTPEEIRLKTAVPGSV